MKPEHRDMIIIDADPILLLDALTLWQAPTVDKWITAANPPSPNLKDS